MRNWMCAVLVSGGLISGAAALEVHSLDAAHNAAAPNFFTLDFGDGVDRVAQITDTTYDLRLNEAAGTAQFVSYEQFIEPIEIPLAPGFSVSTGDLTIRIVAGSSSGTFDSAIGVFTTSEQYEISFTGDLSALGFFSPVILPSTSSGTVTYATPSTGAVDQTWDGEVDIGVTRLIYQCQVSTTFSQRLVGDLNCDASVSAGDINGFVLALTNPAAYAAANPGCDIALADVNGDGRSTVGDIALFVQTLTE